jgi:molybdopterin molybdotransferase
MAEFLHLLPPSEALKLWLQALPPSGVTAAERLPTDQACGRVLAQPIRATEPLPAFPRSTVDGFAVRAFDTFGASNSLPAYLQVIGEVAMGMPASLQLAEGQAVLLHTGGMLPEGADAVVMVEDTQQARPQEIEIFRPVGVGQNVLQAGEDVRPGEIVIQAGVRLRPQEIGGLMALGLTELNVHRQPVVSLISTGDEVIPPDHHPSSGQVRDVNSYSLAALVAQLGSEARILGIVPDQRQALQTAAEKARSQSDLLVITAGSSVSTRDLTATVIQELGQPGVLVHGVALKPGKPTILAVCDGFPVLGLPGNPVSALVVAGLFMPPMLGRLAGLRQPWLPRLLHARISSNVPSEAGREDYLPVILTATPDGWQAEPVYGRSNLIFTLVRADGLVRIPPAATGLAQGEAVQVQLF